MQITLNNQVTDLNVLLCMWLFVIGVQVLDYAIGFK